MSRHNQHALAEDAASIVCVAKATVNMDIALSRWITDVSALKREHACAIFQEDIMQAKTVNQAEQNSFRVVQGNGIKDDNRKVMKEQNW